MPFLHRGLCIDRIPRFTACRLKPGPFGEAFVRPEPLRLLPLAGEKDYPVQLSRGLFQGEKAGAALHPDANAQAAPAEARIQCSRGRPPCGPRALELHEPREKFQHIRENAD